MDRFTVRKDNISNNAIIGLNDDPLYLPVPNTYLSAAIRDFLNGRFEDAKQSRETWLEKTGRVAPPSVY